MVYYAYSFITESRRETYMATSKSGSSTKKPTAKKSTKSSATKVTTVTTVKESPKAPLFKKANDEPKYAAIILAEIIGTFILTLIAILTLQQVAPLYVGLTVTVLVLAIGAVSGSHVNPAVTFGLWSARKLQTKLLPVYWVAQFVGAILAVLILGAFGKGYGLDFSNFGTINWGILGAEAVGAAVFLFGLVAVVSNAALSQLAKAFGIGLSLTLGLLASGSLYTALQGSVDTSKVNVSDIKTIPREYLVKGTVLNPAVALAVTENTPSQLSGYSASKSTDTKYSRLGLEVILGTLIGAALGANLYLLVAYANRKES